MDWDLAIDTILKYLKQHGGATNTTLIELLEGDEILFNKIREHLIFSDLVKDKNSAGLVYIDSDTDPLPVPSEAHGASRRIFLSYGRKDAEELALKLTEGLSDAGHDVWLDREQIRTGKSWEEQIENAILAGPRGYVWMR